MVLGTSRAVGGTIVSFYVGVGRRELLDCFAEKAGKGVGLVMGFFWIGGTMEDACICIYICMSQAANLAEKAKVEAEIKFY